MFALVVRGLLNKQIAHELGTSERTVKAHRHMVMQKCAVRSVAELVMIAERTGMLPADGGARADHARQRTARLSLIEAVGARRHSTSWVACARTIPLHRHRPALDGLDPAMPDNVARRCAS